MSGLFNNLDLFSVGVAVAGIFVLGFIIFFTDRSSITNRSFLLLSLFAAAWSTVNYSYYQIRDIGWSLFFLKLVIFLGVWFVFFLFRMIYVFPLRQKALPVWFKYILLPVTAVTSVLTMTPLVFERVISVDQSGRLAEIQNGWGIYVFAGVVLFLVIGGVAILIRKFAVAPSGSERRQIGIMAVGLLLTFVLIMTFNLILPAFLNDAGYIPLGALFIFPFIIFTAYSIYRHRLFNLSAQDLIYGALAFIACFTTAAGFIYINDVSYRVIAVASFISILLVSIEFIRNLFKLEAANAGQQKFIHYLNHESKGYITHDNVVLNAIIDEDYGAVSPELKKLAEGIRKKNSNAVDDIDELILSSDIGTGAVRYDMRSFDLKKSVEDYLTEYKPYFEEQNDSLAFHADVREDFTVTGDERRLIRHGLNNYLKNALKYTPKGGKIDVSLEKKGNRVILSVADNGYGISDEDKPRMFTEGGKGLRSSDINPDSSGHGLYIVKQLVEAHGGKVGARSDGYMKGSVFSIELPAGSSIRSK